MWGDELGRIIEEKKHFLALIVLVVIGTVIYANSFGNGFVWDDFPLLVHNIRIRSLRNIPAMFLNIKGGGYRPLREASYALDYFFWGLNPWGYHLSNLLFHLLNAVLVYSIMNLLFGRWKLALLIGIFFVSHPIATESVTWISGRRDVLTAFFFFLALFLYLKSNRPSRGKIFLYLGSLTAFILALMAKEMAITLPLVIILSDYSFRLRKKSATFMAWIKPYLPFLVLTLFFALFFLKVSTAQEGKYHWYGSRLLMVLNSPKLISSYLGLLLLPLNLSADHFFPISTSLRSWPLLASWGLIFFLGGVLLWSFRRSRPLFFSLGWFFLTLLPVSNIFVPLRNPLSERFLYIPALGFYVFLALTLEKIGTGRWGRFSLRGGRKWAPVLFILLLIFYGSTTWRRNSDWKNSLTLWSKTVQQNSVSPRVWNNLGIAYMKRGRYDKAGEAFRESLRLNPAYLLPYLNLGYLYEDKGEDEGAVKVYKEALALNPGSAKLHKALADVYGKQGKNKAALRHYRKALALDPGWAEAHYDLGVFLQERKKYPQAMGEYRQALKLRPDYARAHNRLGIIYLYLGKAAQARKEFTQALQIDPGLLQTRKVLEALKKLKVNSSGHRD